MKSSLEFNARMPFVSSSRFFFSAYLQCIPMYHALILFIPYRDDDYVYMCVLD